MLQLESTVLVVFRECLKMTFPIYKRINTELFIDRTASLNRGMPQIRVEINEVDQP